MFSKTQYVIEMKLGSAFFGPARDAYNVKDAYGNLLGYVKRQRFKNNFWFEGTDGTHMGEIRSSKKGYEVYDAQNQHRTTLIQKPPPPGKRKWLLLGLVLCTVGIPMAITVFMGLVLIGIEGLPFGFFEGLSITVFGVALTVIGIIFSFSSLVRPEWRVEDPEDQQLAEIKLVGKFSKEYQILTPDEGIIAHIHKKRGLAAIRYSYSINITRQILDPRSIISFTVLMAYMDRSITTFIRQYN